MTAQDVIKRVCLGIAGLVAAVVGGIGGARVCEYFVRPVYSDVGINNVVAKPWAVSLGLLTYAILSLGLLAAAARLSRSSWQSAYNYGGTFILLGAGIVCALLKVAFGR